MKLLLLLLIAAGAAGFYFPAQLEVTPNGCAALDKRVRMLAEVEFAKLTQGATPQVQGAIAAGKAQVPAGVIIEGFVRDKLPFLPPEVACVTAYWITVLQPDLRQIAPGLLPPPRTP